MRASTVLGLMKGSWAIRGDLAKNLATPARSEDRQNGVAGKTRKRTSRRNGRIRQTYSKLHKQVWCHRLLSGPRLAGQYHLGVARPVPEDTLRGTAPEQRAHLAGEIAEMIN